MITLFYFFQGKLRKINHRKRKPNNAQVKKATTLRSSSGETSEVSVNSSSTFELERILRIFHCTKKEICFDSRREHLIVDMSF